MRRNRILSRRDRRIRMRWRLFWRRAQSRRTAAVEKWSEMATESTHRIRANRCSSQSVTIWRRHSFKLRSPDRKRAQSTDRARREGFGRRASTRYGMDIDGFGDDAQELNLTSTPSTADRPQRIRRCSVDRDRVRAQSRNVMSSIMEIEVENEEECGRGTVAVTF